nr:hydroxylysine kinase-like [Lytechinus pictus]
MNTLDMSNRYACSRCDKTFSRKYDMQRHEQNEHDTGEETSEDEDSDPSSQMQRVEESNDDSETSDYSGDKSMFIKRNHEYAWCLGNVSRVGNLLHVLKDDSQRKLIREVLDSFQEKVTKREEKLTKGFIHGDFNDYNILVREQSSSSVCNGDGPGDNKDVAGILDFDDTMYSSIVYDIAIAIMYMMQCTNLERDPMESGGIVLAGYLSKHALSGDDWEALYYCIAARFAQSLVMGLYAHSQQPQNTYLLSTQKVGWQVLFDLWGQEVDDLYGQWRKIIKQYND